MLGDLGAVGVAGEALEHDDVALGDVAAPDGDRHLDLDVGLSRREADPAVVEALGQIAPCLVEPRFGTRGLSDVGTGN